MIPGFRREVDENCALMRYYAASSGNCLPTFRDILSVLPAPPTLFPIQGVSRLEGTTAGGDFLGLCDQKSSYVLLLPTK